MGKNYPSMQLPSPSTLSITALNDIYQVALTKIKDDLAEVHAICLMMEGWTDRYCHRSYMGIHISFVRSWKFTVNTLSCEMLPDHIACAIADHAVSSWRYFS